MGDITSSGCNTGSYPSPNGPDKSQEIVAEELLSIPASMWPGAVNWLLALMNTMTQCAPGKSNRRQAGKWSVWVCFCSRKALFYSDSVRAYVKQQLSCWNSCRALLQVRAPQLGTSVWSEFHQEQYDQMLSWTRKAAATGCRMPKAWPQSTSVSRGMVPLITMLCVHCFIVPWFYWQENTANWTSSRLYNWVHLC